MTGLDLSTFWSDPDRGAAAILAWARANNPAATVTYWDFDGVIADSEPVHQEAYLEVASDFGFFIPQGVRVRPGLPEERSWDGFNEDGAAIPREAYGELRAARRAIVVSNLIAQGPTTFADHVLHSLHDAGMPQVLASMGDPETNRVLLEAWGLSDLFSPGPAGLTKTELLRSGGALFFEDNLPYIVLAEECNIPVVGLRHSVNETQVWPPIPWTTLQAPLL